jgi:hypothetical protein
MKRGIRSTLQAIFLNSVPKKRKEVSLEGKQQQTKEKLPRGSGFLMTNIKPPSF